MPKVIVLESGSAEAALVSQLFNHAVVFIQESVLKAVAEEHGLSLDDTKAWMQKYADQGDDGFGYSFGGAPDITADYVNGVGHYFIEGATLYKQ